MATTRATATQTAVKRPTERIAPGVPMTMRASAINRFGPPEVLTVHTLPVPSPGPREVLIEMYAAGVGGWDAWVRSDPSSVENSHFPVVLGTDGAGKVVGVGSRVRRFHIGQRVWAYEFSNPKGGFYAEYVAVSADRAGLVPETLDLLSAAAGCVTGLTALQGIDDHLQLGAREAVLIFGASGAVGTLAVQFAKRLPTLVVGTATGEDASTLVRQLGADHVIDARAAEAADKLRTFAPKGLDAVLALAGGEGLERCLDLVRDGGRVAYPNGVEPPPRRRSNVRLIAYDVVAGPREFEALGRAVEEVKLRVPLAAVYPLERAVEAHSRLERGHVLGRIALRIREREE
jgi:NADPH2:quinone reductase